MKLCVALDLIPEAGEKRFDPEGTVTCGQMVENAAQVLSYLTIRHWDLPPRPADWGVAVLRLDDPDWVFDPAAPVTRAQFAAVLLRLLRPSAR